MNLYRSIFFLGLITCCLSFLSAQEVRIKVFPPEAQLMAEGERLPFYTESENVRVYQLNSSIKSLNFIAWGYWPQQYAWNGTSNKLLEVKLELKNRWLNKTAEIITAARCRALTFSPDGQFLLAPLMDGSGIEVYSTQNYKKIKTLIPSGNNDQSPFTDAIIPQGSQELWVAQANGTIQIFNLVNLTWKQSINSSSSGIAQFTDLGRDQLLLTNWDYNSILAIQVPNRTINPGIGLSSAPRGTAFKDSTAYLSLFDQGKIQLLNLKNGTTIGYWPIGGAPRAIAASNKLIFIGDMASGQIIMIDPQSQKEVERYSVASNPQTAAASLNGKLIAIAFRGRNNPNDYTQEGPEFGKVGLFNGDTGELLSLVWGKNQPTALAFSSDSKTLAFTDYLDNTIEIYHVDQQ